MSSLFVHQTVLLEETVQAVLGAADGVYVDATFGRGGHSRELLSRLGPEAVLIAFDKDPEAVAAGVALAVADPRLVMVHASFADLTVVLARHGLSGKVDGIMADLGVSSPQLDDASRGFSFMHDGPLDMRMNTATGLSAAQWLAATGEQDLADAIYRFGEERFSRRIARAIKQHPEPILTTRQLAEVVAAAHPAWEKHKHPATRTFQAIRIAVNHELDDVARFLPDAMAALKPGGKLAVISFHSLEDRLVKHFFRRLAQGEADDLPRDFPIRAVEFRPTAKSLGKIDPSKAEVARNPRARSAHLRVAMKLESAR
ncbi:MAG TPA: 16S rRNA (cytosine(1402)-N(4))-methyltransferase RsmH [Fluviicoccus sp.]|nr:16S rRNA (cytosine(1402)-N(4))-methyltransferase RsmH [Fluviicoccus sp.]